MLPTKQPLDALQIASPVGARIRGMEDDVASFVDGSCFQTQFTGAAQRNVGGVGALPTGGVEATS